MMEESSASIRSVKLRLATLVTNEGREFLVYDSQSRKCSANSSSLAHIGHRGVEEEPLLWRVLLSRSQSCASDAKNTLLGVGIFCVLGRDQSISAMVCSDRPNFGPTYVEYRCHCHLG